MQPEDLLSVPHCERRVFKRHFLNSVHCELSTAIDLERLAAAREALASELQKVGFRYVRDLHQGNFAFQPSAEGNIPPRLQGSTVVSGLTFGNDNPQRLLNITTSGLVLSDMAYSGFEDFRSRLGIAATLVRQQVSDAPVTKIGLRKVNAIRIDSVADPAQAVAPFNSQLFGLARSRAIVPAALKACHELLFLERGTLTCNLRTTLSAPGTPNSYDVQLDFDVQQRQQPESLDSELAAMNSFIYDVFRWAITDEFIGVLES
ncbi:MAG: TIGR04255 family protein [Steroidobacteraceae bacterium]